MDKNLNIVLPNRQYKLPILFMRSCNLHEALHLIRKRNLDVLLYLNAFDSPINLFFLIRKVLDLLMHNLYNLFSLLLIAQPIIKKNLKDL